MGRIVGIDLGTTYSAVAVPEERTGDGFLAARGVPGCAVILDRFKRPITPSVVAEDDTGKVVVGQAAKGRAGLAPEPVMFSKRYMGEDKTFALKKLGSLTPVDAAAHVLRYLKELAEFRLGEPVDEAVVTVPAYFSLLAKQMTEKAAEMAGLKVAQIAQEPVAAALMYCARDTRDPLRLLTYDLGGGTFDVAILEKRDGVIATDSIRAFEGDRFLGGYNFDTQLAHWLLGQLRGQGYDLRHDPNDAADRVIWAKLMVYAERAKIALSQVEQTFIQEPSTGITDRNGEPVAIDVEVTRETFEGLIAPLVEDTIRLCRKAREKAPPADPANEFDEILLVGGSSRVPLVARRLEAEFGRKPKLVEPDLCVALGAAILAGTKARSFGGLKLDPLPETTDLPTLAVTGRVVAPDAGAAEVTLRAADGSFRNVLRAKPDGAFAFPSVPLRAEAATDFALAAAVAGKEVGAHRFTVRRTAGGGRVGVEAVTNVLSRPIKIRLVDEDHTIAPEKTPLPFRVPLVRTRTTDTTGTIRIPVLEESTPLGSIVLENVPATLAVGSAVELTLTIEANYQITGQAAVPTLGLTHPVRIDLPKPKTPTRAELEARYAELDRRATDAQTALSGPARFEKGSLVRQVKDRLAAARGMLDDAVGFEPARVGDCLDEVEGLVRKLAAGWKPDPPLALLVELDEDAERQEARLVKQRPEAAKDGYTTRRKTIRAEADAAYAAQSSAAWADACQKMERLCEELEQLLARANKKRGGDDDGGSRPPPDPRQQLMQLRQSLAGLAEQARRKQRYDALADEFREAEAALARIDASAKDATSRLNDWYFSRHEPLREKIDRPVRSQPKPGGGNTELGKPGGGSS